MTRRLSMLFGLMLLLAGAAPLAAAPVLTLSLTGSRPHPPDHYTQGLFFLQGRLFESAGLYGRSSVTKWDFGSGGAPGLLQKWSVPAEYFAEGATAANDELYLLTWREETGFVLDPATLMVKRRFSYLGEGWGLAWDGARLWRSDGSARLFPHRPGDFAPDGEPLTVRDEGREVPYLNEMEWDPETGLLLANVYGQDMVAAIDLADGRVRFWLDGRPLRALARQHGLVDTGRPMDTVLNGLAVDGQSLWLAGKYWPRLYRAAWPPEGWSALK